MPDFERSLSVQADAARVLDYVSDPSNLPSFLPTLRHAETMEGDKIRVQGEAAGEGYDRTGWMRREGDRLTWGSDGDRDYHGEMLCESEGPGGCRLTVRLHVNPPESERQQMEGQPGGMEANMEEGLQQTLERIRQAVEGGGRRNVA